MEVLQTRPEIQNFLESVIKEQEIDNYKITDVQTNDKGEGYLGQILMVTIKNISNGDVLDFVIKVAFNNEQIRKMVPIKNSFLNEIIFYTKVHPAFAKLETPGSYLVPKCYKTASEEENEMLCLENLKNSGFEIFPKREILDDDHISFIFKSYGRFHASSFALKKQHPEEYADISTKLYNLYDEFVTNPDGKFTEFLDKIYTRIHGYLEPGEDDKLIAKFEKYREGGLVQCYHKIVKENCEYSAILHGDCWSNNMMFKYQDNGTGKKVVDLKLIDFQLSKIGSPVCDLSYCLYSGASKSAFDNLDKYLKKYHESLSSTLKKIGFSADKLFPFNALKEDWKKYSAFGMIMALAIIQMKTTKQEDIQDLTDFVGNEFPEPKFDEELYRKRVKELLYHLLEIDAL